MKYSSLTNEELVREVGLITNLNMYDERAVFISTEVLMRLADGRAVLAEPGEELSGVNTECPCCGEAFRALADGNVAY